MAQSCGWPCIGNFRVAFGYPRRASASDRATRCLFFVQGWEVASRRGSASSNDRLYVSDTAIPSTSRAARPARAANTQLTHSFTSLAQSVKAAGLQGRTRWFYGLVAARPRGRSRRRRHGHDPARRLLAAAADGRRPRCGLHPVRLLGHEASHRQVLGSGPANDRVGRVLAHAVRRDQLLVVDEQAHPTPRQPEQDRQGPRHRDRHVLLPRRGRGHAAAGDGLVHPPPGLLLLPAAAARGRQPAPQVHQQPVRTGAVEGRGSS